MSHIERSRKTPSRRTGAFATLRAFLRGTGTGAPSATLYTPRRALVGLAAVATFAVAAAPTLAAGGPPAFLHKSLRDEFHATRVAIVPTLEADGLSTEWHAEYATSKQLLEEGKGIVAASGTEGERGGVGVHIGAVDGAAGDNTPYLRQLTPNTSYVARFDAKNADGVAEETIEFKTLPVGKPEIAQLGDGELNSPNGSTFTAGGPTSTSAAFKAQIESDGAPTEYHFEVSAFAIGPWTPCAGGSVSVAEEFAIPAGQCLGLSPETEYFLRLQATNKGGSVEETKSFTTPTAKVTVGKPELRNVTAASVHLEGSVVPRGSKTQWRFESAISQSGPWTPVPGAAGTISQAQAEARPFSFRAFGVEGALKGLDPAKTYYLRLVAENEPEAGHHSEATSEAASFETFGPPSAITFATHALHGESLRLLAAVNPNSVPTTEEQSITIAGAPTGGTFTLTFKGQSTAGIPYNADPETVGRALSALSSAPEVFAFGPSGGPYTVWFEGKNVEGDQPQIEADASGLTPSGSVTVATVQQGGEAYDTHYHFEYVSQKQFEAPGGEGGFAKATSTPEFDAGSGNSTEGVGVDLPALQPGETYRYRILATNTSSVPNPVVDGAEQTLTVPAVLQPGPEEPCSNEALRTGASAKLPDCRAYEQLTPLDKEGAQEAFHYGPGTTTAVLAGADGDHLILDTKPTRWGAGQSPYFFSRAAGGWQMTAGTTQPDFGLNQAEPQIFNADLTSFGFSSGFETFGAVSKDLEFGAGPPGGPYTTIATIPRKQVGTGGGWEAASADFSKLILAVEDRELVEPRTTTKSGLDLYEYTDDALRQVNVGIGTCGAHIVRGREDNGSHSLSPDGSRVFFEAVPGNDCSLPSHLYIRVDGTETLDLGAVGFLAANEAGSEVLLERTSGEAHEVLLFNAETAAETHLFTTQSAVHSDELLVSGGPKLTALYFASSEQLTPEAPPVQRPTPELRESSNVYQYEIPSEKLHFVAQATPSSVSGGFIKSVSPDGGYVYFDAAAVAGLPGGAKLLLQGGKTSGTDTSPQIYRYDSAENVLECVSCASPFDPEPRLPSVLEALDASPTYVQGQPSYTSTSANGDFAFFSTPAALVPSDVDGEIVPLGAGEKPGEYESVGGLTSPSSDVYEWRKDGVNGCSHLQGCLALITSGRGGLQNVLLGSADEGRDVFVFTHSQLLPQDDDTAADIYDARIGGGFPPAAPRSVECEGDACSTPFAPPNDPTPSSFTFHGAGNPPPATAPTPKVKPKPKKKVVKKKSKKKKKGKKSSRKAKKSAKGRN